MTRTARLGLLSALSFTLLATPAFAGTYDVWQCKDPVSGTPLNDGVVEGWTLSRTTPAEDWGSANNCGTAGGGFGLESGSGGGTIAADNGANLKYAEMVFAPPADTTLHGYELYRAAETTPPAGQQSYFAMFYHRSDTEFCHGYFTDGCGLGDADTPFAAVNRVTRPASPDHAGGISFRLGCDAPNCSKQATGAAPNARFYVFSARLTLRDDSLPAIASLGGSVFEKATVSGTERVDLRATDNGGGVREAFVTSSKTPGFRSHSPLGSVGCTAPRLVHLVPCPRGVTRGFDVDTTQLVDGPQNLSLTVVDAAGNTASATRSVIVDNGGALNGAPASEQALLTILSAKTVRTTYGARVVVRGRLTDPSGRTINGARIDVDEKLRGAQSFTPVDGSVTDSSGIFTVTPRIAGSRTLRFAYRYRTQRPAVASADVTVVVRARVLLRAPKRARGRTPIRFSGSVKGARRGALILIEGRSGGRWGVAARARVGRDGKFTARRRIKLTLRPTTFQFRAYYAGADDSALERARSKAVRVRYVP